MTESKKAIERQKALDYHKNNRPGKIEVTPTKPTMTASDLSLAYSPGVAHPCIEISEDPNKAADYTAKSNLVGVVTNGSAVLGLGNIGPLASKPVMEGKGVLFKTFADIDVFDIEVNEPTVEGMVKVVKALEPTFGGINLEDIKAPECFEIEKQLREQMNIPVFHDDQHGTAIIASAAFINAIELTNRDIKTTKVVFSGAGAAALAIAKLFLKLGAKKENIVFCDSKGVISKSRDDLNKYKQEFAVDTNDKTLEDALKNADAFMGCSMAGLVSQDMVKSMNKKPIIFAMANPVPEIMPEEVWEVRDDAIVATGRTDYPNQVNNVLGFPFIFRGALDVRATKINDEMKLAAVKALADLAKEEVPASVKLAYGDKDFCFGADYLIPKPFDKRVLTRVSPAVAKAAMETGVARNPIDDFSNYALELDARLGTGVSFLRYIKNRLNKDYRPKLLFAEGLNGRILQAVSILKDEGLIEPVVMGNPERVKEQMDFFGLSQLKDSIEIIKPQDHPAYEDYCMEFYADRQRKGTTQDEAKELMKNTNYFGSMLLKNKEVQGLITGATQNYPTCIKPIMQILAPEHIDTKLAGVMILIFKSRVIFLADCTVQKSPNSKELSDIALSTAALYEKLMQKKPRVAFLSYSSFGSNRSQGYIKEAVKITQDKAPEMIVDGEMQADIAVNSVIRKGLFQFSELDNDADILIFPDLNSSNISYKLLTQLAGATAIGPLLTPLSEAANIVQRTSTVEQIVHMSHLTILKSQLAKRKS